MTTFRQHRCSHCGVRYEYQTSGSWGATPKNSNTHCCDCYQVIQEALSKVPSRCKREWVRTLSVSAKTLEDLERTRWDAAKANGQIVARRILPGLFDLERPSNQHRQGIVKLDGYTYRYEYWTEQGGVEAGKVYLEVEQDTATGEILGPWDLNDCWQQPKPVVSEEFRPVGRKSLNVEPLPQGCLPIYDRDPDGTDK